MIADQERNQEKANKEEKLSKWIIVRHDNDEQLAAYLDKLIAEKNGGEFFDKKTA